MFTVVNAILSKNNEKTENKCNLFIFYFTVSVTLLEFKNTINPSIIVCGLTLWR